MERYKADSYGSYAFGVFSVDDVDSDKPLVMAYSREAAEDLTRAMNRAAESAGRAGNQPTAGSVTPPNT